MADKVKITIDGVEYEVEAGSNVLQALLDKGQVIPHFCYHEALGPAGSCRLCACMIAPGADKPARLEMSCMVRAADGMVITLKDDYSLKFRKQLIEDLMLNHPHDCPVCDEGGECMLQDMTVMNEHQHRRTRFEKRTWVNQDLGPFVHHEMNRCITCYRCVRYYRDYALGDDFGVFGSRSRVYFGRVEDGTLESPFSGNLVDVCPTGVFTDKQFRDHYTRPWDLQTSRSICPNCSLGCNMLPGYRHNTLRRIKPAENKHVNRFFICDRGRYGAEFVNQGRIEQATFNGTVKDIDTVISDVSTRLKDVAKQHGPASIAAFGSDRSTMEANAALNLLLKGVASNRVSYFGTGDERATVRRAASITAGGEITVPSHEDIEKADFVLILGGDVTGEAPGFDLAVRQSVKVGNPLFICSPRAGELDKFATASWRCLPGEEATITSFIGSVPTDAEPAEDNFVQTVAVALRNAKKPVILCSAVHHDADLVEAAFSLAKNSTLSANRSCGLAYFFNGMNSVGAGLIRNDEDPDALWDDIEAEKIKALIVCEHDLVASAPNRPVLDLLGRLEFLLVIDSNENETTLRANAILPCISHYQSFGTVVNYEGRAQAFDGMQFSSPVNLAASEILASLIQKAEIEEHIGGTEFHDIYDVTSDSSKQMDRLRTGDAGCIVRTSPKLPPQSRGLLNQGSQEGKLKLWKVYHVFGSDELSSYSPAIMERAPASPYVELHPEDAATLGLNVGDSAEALSGYGVTGSIQINEKLAKGTIAVPVLFDNVKTTNEVTA